MGRTDFFVGLLVSHFQIGPNSLRPFEVGFHIWAWCMAMIFSFIPLGIDALGSELLVPFPFVSLHAAKWIGWVCDL